MFTGLVTDVGRLVEAETGNDGRRFRIATVYDPATIEIGASICCDGICLTAVDKGGEAGNAWFDVFAAAETLRVTTATDWQQGRRINLERSLKAGDELGGHIVSGHVDAVATIITTEDVGDQRRIDIEAPAEVMPFIAAKGSVALNGTSLTVNTVTDGQFSVHLIPHTLDVTNWDESAPGARINLEVDPLARYAARLIETLNLPKAGQ